jgi:hypothetical protein
MKGKLLTPGLATVVWLAVAAPGHAAEGAWCAYEATGTNAYSSRCDLPSFEACRAWTQGMAGTWCTQNPAFAPSSRLPSAGNRRPRTR